MKEGDNQFAALSEWLPTKDGPVLVSGPCSAESEEQVVETARALNSNGRVSLFRAGVWKPRTRPDAFEGMGEPALEWMVSARAETGLQITTEVANARHVEACLKAGIDVLWIGARTTVNPFYVQEIADALMGVDVPVMIKNPVNPDVNLWIGAVERLLKTGNPKLAAIHRGFTSSNPSIFRNEPMWELPIELRTTFPELPLLCDPSHIAGKRSLLATVVQRAIDLDMDGLMIEVHPNPDAALSDAQQQLTPAALEDLIQNIQFRTATTSNREFKTQLSELRNIIDRLDAELIERLAARMEVAEQIGQYKKNNCVTIFQLKRWNEILRTRTSKGELLGLSETFMKSLLQAIHNESIRIQTEVMNDGKPREKEPPNEQ